MIGRRLPIVDGKPSWPEQPGDYCGPVLWHGELKVFFLKPNARDKDAPRIARSIHHVSSPPHVFTECADGSLTIRESLGDRHVELAGEVSDGWHGYLTNGTWEKV
jgi:hypothetical protein